MVHYIYWLEPKKAYQRRDPSELQVELPLDLLQPNRLDKRTVVERSDAFPTAATRVKSPAPPAASHSLLRIREATRQFCKYWRNPADLFLSWFNNSIFNFARRTHPHHQLQRHHGIFWEHFGRPVKVYDNFQFPLLPASVERRRAPVVLANISSPIRSHIETEVGLQVLLNDPFEPVAYI